MGRTALVTGDASGIGRACAERLTADGLSVVAPGADLRPDVTSPAAVEETAAGLAVDVLVNPAGVIGPDKPFTEVTDTEWAATFAVNVPGVFQVCRAFVPGMVARGWGRVVNVASIAGKEGTRTWRSTRRARPRSWGSSSPSARSSPRRACRSTRSRPRWSRHP